MIISKRKYTRQTEVDEADDENEIEEVVKNDKAQQSTLHQNENKHLKMMSWNIDGLDETSLTNRCNGVVRVLKK